MSDKAASANDRVADNQGTKGLNVTSAGLDPCHRSFNDLYRDMLKSQLSKITGEELDEETLRRVEDRLSKNGMKMEELASDPENHEAALSQALTQAKDSYIEEEML